VRLAMALVVNRCADYGSSGVMWAQDGEFVAHTFGRQALPIVWDFAETVLWADTSGNFDGAVDWVARVIEAWPGSSSGQAQVADAAAHPLPDDAATVWFTDPPYYDAVPYADLSDFFFVWLKRALPGHPLLRDPFDPANALTPKTAEIVQNAAVRLNGVVKDRAFFEEGMARAFREGRRVLRDDGIGAVVFAHKSTEGWEALLSGLVRAGWTVTASWPLVTERSGRLRARESAALAASVHLVLRPRPEDAPVGDWGAVLRELPRRVGEWMGRLQGEGIRGADLVFACIGPALEIFSRHARVETAEGRQVTLNEYLEKIWEVVGRAALQQVLGADGGTGALEEDARLTALFLWTLQSTNGLRANGQTASPVEAASDEEEELAEGGDDEDEDEAGRGSGARAAGGFSLVYDVVRRFAQPLGIHLPRWEGRVIEIKKGVVRLLTLRERARVLFGPEGMELVAERIERAPRGPVQLALALPDAAAPSRPSSRRDRDRRHGRRPGGRGANGAARRHHAGPRAHGHAAPGGRSGGGAAGAAYGGGGARAGLPPPGQCPLRPLPWGQRGEAPGGRHAPGGAEMSAGLPFERESAVAAAIAAMVDRIVAQARPERVILFGSHATGRARPDSDVGLLIVFPDEADPRDDGAALSSPGRDGRAQGPDRGAGVRLRPLAGPGIAGVVSTAQREGRLCSLVPRRSDGEVPR
jgi:putative DNA methylase